MERNKRLLAAWQNGVVLGHAWRAVAEKGTRRLFGTCNAEGRHLGLRRSLEIDLIARLFAGELQAIGIEGGSDAGPIHIPQYYFSRTAEIDWDKETVTAIGKKFHEITVQGNEAGDGVWVCRWPLDPRLILREDRTGTRHIAEPTKTSTEPRNEAERKSQTKRRRQPEPSDKPPIPRRAKGSAEETPPGRRAHAAASRRWVDRLWCLTFLRLVRELN